MKNDFSSIDKLVEFGLGLGVANQMINTMNTAIEKMKVPGANSYAQQQDFRYFVVIDQAQAGPFTEEEVVQLIKSGKVTSETLVWRHGLNAWTMAENLPETNRLLLLYK